MLCSIFAALLLASQTNGQSVGSVTLAWSASPSTNVAGYYIFYGPSSGNYTNEVIVPGATNVTIRGLVNGATYYIAAAAYNSAYQEGSMSSAISVTAGAIPGAAGLLTAIANLPAGQYGFAVAGTAGDEYTVQASTDLVHWVTLQTNAAPFNFVDSNASQFSHRFYRTFYNPN